MDSMDYVDCIIAHRTVGRVARTNAYLSIFEVMFRVMMMVVKRLSFRRLLVNLLQVVKRTINS